MDAAFCPQCGQARVGTLRFCQGCRYDFADAGSGVASVQPATPTNPSGPGFALPQQPNTPGPAVGAPGPVDGAAGRPASARPILGSIGAIVVVLFLVLRYVVPAFNPFTITSGGTNGTVIGLNDGSLCPLISSDQIAQIMGGSPIPGGTSGINVGGVRSCTWIFNLSPAVAATIMYHQSDESYYVLPGSVSISGLGGQANWNAEVGELSIDSGGHEIDVSASGGRSDPQTEAIAIARLALPQLP